MAAIYDGAIFDMRDGFINHKYFLGERIKVSLLLKIFLILKEKGCPAPKRGQQCWTPNRDAIYQG